MTASGDGVWREWFKDACAAGAGGDLMFLADEAPDLETEIDARLEAANSLISAGATGPAEEQIVRVLSKRPTSPRAREMRARLTSSQAPAAGAPSVAFIFSGHMVDGPARPAPRFPATSVESVAQAIRERLGDGGAREGCIAVSSAAAGGDLLFIEASMAFGMKVAACLPFEEERFLASSVSFAGQEWVDRYFKLTRASRVTLRVLPLEPPPGSNPYERCNRWQLYAALASGAPRVHGIVVWNGRTGDGPGGTGHMVDELTRYRIRIDVIDPLAG